MRWLYLAIVVVFVAALIIFVFQNTGSVSVSFLTMAVELPIAVVVVGRLRAGRVDRREPLWAVATIGGWGAALGLKKRCVSCAPWSSIDCMNGS